jgi:hypothetical protein
MLDFAISSSLLQIRTIPLSPGSARTLGCRVYCALTVVLEQGRRESRHSEQTLFSATAIARDIADPAERLMFLEGRQRVNRTEDCSLCRGQSESYQPDCLVKIHLLEHLAHTSQLAIINVGQIQDKLSFRRAEFNFVSGELRCQ